MFTCVLGEKKNIVTVPNCNHINTVKMERKSFLTIATTDAEFESEAKETGKVHAIVVRALVIVQRSEIVPSYRVWCDLYWRSSMS